MKVQPIEVCCAPVTAGALDEAEAAELAGVFKVLADPARLRLLSMVASAETGEACACDLVEPVGRSQPNMRSSTVLEAATVATTDSASPRMLSG